MEKEIWLLIAGMALVTVIPRIIPFFFIKGDKLPPAAREWLRLLPIVIFTSMIAPPLLTAGTDLSPAKHLEEMAVVATGGVVAFLTKKIPAALAAAVCTFLLVSFN